MGTLDLRERNPRVGQNRFEHGRGSFRRLPLPNASSKPARLHRVLPLGWKGTAAVEQFANKVDVDLAELLKESREQYTQYMVFGPIEWVFECPDFSLRI